MLSERLFTMLDKTGDEQVNYREFIVGISPMITGTGKGTTTIQACLSNHPFSTSFTKLVLLLYRGCLFRCEASDKVSFALELFDVENTGFTRSSDLNSILTSMNNVASYFGDPVMTAEQIEELVEQLYKEHDLQVG